MSRDFINSDDRLIEKASAIETARKKAGLEGLTGGLECVIINTEPDRFTPAVQELLRYTGLQLVDAFQDQRGMTAVLAVENSADFLITTRAQGDTPFAEHNNRPKSAHLPGTRLETLVFSSTDLETYVRIQKERGLRFLTEDIACTPTHAFIQTRPSRFTGNSLGFIEWKGTRTYRQENSQDLSLDLAKPDLPHLKNIGRLDHCATRVRAEERDAAILEFMEFTEYDFDFAVYVESLNSITNVARLTHKDYAQVFTSGIAPFTDLEHSGPTERFIHNYGTRVHHMAFDTKNIEETFAALKEDGMGFLVELVGSPEEGLKQTFSEASPNTLLVNEYIHRFGAFDGFFTKSNVTLLTRATEKQ